MKKICKNYEINHLNCKRKQRKELLTVDNR